MLRGWKQDSAVGKGQRLKRPDDFLETIRQGFVVGFVLVSLFSKRKTQESRVPSKRVLCAKNVRPVLLQEILQHFSIDD